MGRTHRTCRRCGFGVPADSPVCPGCRRPAVDDWRRRARAAATAERQTRKHPPLDDRGYRSLLTLAEIARFALGAATVVAVATAVAYAVWTFRVDDPTFVVDSRTVDIGDVARASTVALLGAVAATGLSFVAWAVRAYRNLPALGINERRYWTIWLVVGWVIPGANLLVPKLVIDDIWRASSPAVLVDGGDEWHRRPVASLVNRWWSSFLVTPAIVVLAAVTARGGLDEFGQQAAVGSLAALASASIVVASLAARRLVAIVTVAQARRADVVVDLRERRVGATEPWSATEHSLR